VYASMTLFASATAPYSTFNVQPRKKKEKKPTEVEYKTVSKGMMQILNH